ncbi:MAG: fumarylacetoacetase [Beijerinckiaceae bacterium]|nr:fumarylacetoacetase [Beijerinckiaceae bacterium]
MNPNDPALRSFVEGAADSDFPIQNLPYGVFSTASDTRPRVGVAIGAYVLDLAAVEEAGLIPRMSAQSVFRQPSLNALMASGGYSWSIVRKHISGLLAHDNPKLRDATALRNRALIPQADVQMHLPVAVAGYTDFYSSREHATNVGTMFRGKDNALNENWLWVPIGYNGRASTVVVSGTPVKRPKGQIKGPDFDKPMYMPSRRLDIELEMGAIVGANTQIGSTLSIDQAQYSIFGFTLLNDWSARDIQQWEYVPLGPFQGKAFATSIGAWVVTSEALEPFRVEGPKQDPAPLDYLRQSGPHNYDIALEIDLTPKGGRATTISRSNFRNMYWSTAQQIAHHASSGCAMRIGDLIGSGTISGADKGSYGSLLELSWGGKEPITLADGSTRTFLEDGDVVTIRGFCQGEGYRIGLGEVSGQIVAAD